MSVDSASYPMSPKDALYIGRGSQKIAFASDDPAAPAKFYFVSLPAHSACPARHITIEDAERVVLGSQQHANRRTIYKYIHPNDVQSCQLVMGFTELAPGSIWNTMPAHIHERRSEVYMYFDLADDSVVFHFMGQAHETRHIVVRNSQAVLSPSWSIHSGAGTGSYSFVWAMGGENQDFDDMDWITMEQLA
jgi:4-deoxy-L-threo-5-hexosulose-uronate ketol-isomerase